MAGDDRSDASVDGEPDLGAEDTALAESASALLDAATALLADAAPETTNEAEAVNAVRNATAQGTCEAEAAVFAAEAEVASSDAFRHLPLLAAAAIMLLIVTTALLTAPGVAPTTVHRFESGHRVVAAGGARWNWEATAEGLRIRVHSGEVMFDVDPDASQPLRVFSGGVTVRVTGTVFTVEQERDVTRVAVFEGSVALTGNALLSFLEAGDRWEGEPRRCLSMDDAVVDLGLAAEARWAAERRIERGQRLPDIVPVLPEVPDLAADGRLPGTTLDDPPDSNDVGAPDGTDTDTLSQR